MPLSPIYLDSLSPRWMQSHILHHRSFPFFFSCHLSLTCHSVHQAMARPNQQTRWRPRFRKHQEMSHVSRIFQIYHSIFSLLERGHRRERSGRASIQGQHGQGSLSVRPFLYFAMCFHSHLYTATFKSLSKRTWTNPSVLMAKTASTNISTTTAHPTPSKTASTPLCV